MTSVSTPVGEPSSTAGGDSAVVVFYDLEMDEMAVYLHWDTCVVSTR